MTDQLPIGKNGLPMIKITTGVLDKMPTVQYGATQIGPITMTRWIEDDGDGVEARQKRIDMFRSLQQEVEYACGVERRLLQWAIDPAAKFRSPVTGQEAFAAPPEGYDPNKMVNPAAIAEAAVAQHIAQQQTPAQPDPNAPRMNTHQANAGVTPPPAAPGVSVG